MFVRILYLVMISFNRSCLTSVFKLCLLSNIVSSLFLNVMAEDQVYILSNNVSTVLGNIDHGKILSNTTQTEAYQDVWLPSSSALPASDTSDSMLSSYSEDGWHPSSTLAPRILSAIESNSTSDNYGNNTDNTFVEETTNDTVSRNSRKMKFNLGVNRIVNSKRADMNKHRIEALSNANQMRRGLRRFHGEQRSLSNTDRIGKIRADIVNGVNMDSWKATSNSRHYRTQLMKSESRDEWSPTNSQNSEANKRVLDSKISVHKKCTETKGDCSSVEKGFRRIEDAKANISTSPIDDFRPSLVDKSLEVDKEDNNQDVDNENNNQDVAEDRSSNDRTFHANNNHHIHRPHEKSSAPNSISEKIKYVFPFLKGFGSGLIGAKLKNMFTNHKKPTVINVYPKYNYNPKTGTYYISEKGQFVLSPRPPKTPISSLPTIDELPGLESSKVPFIISSHSHPKLRTKIKMIPVPYNVEVEKKVPYLVKVPYDNPVPVHISEPYGVPVEKIVPYPVRVEIPDPYPVTRIVKKPYNLYFENPVPVEVEQPYPLVKEKLKPIPVETVINTPYLETVHNSFTVSLPYDKNIPIPVNPAEHSHNEGIVAFHNSGGEEFHNVPFHATPNNHESGDLIVSPSSHIGQHPSQRLPHMMAYLQPPRLSSHDNRGKGNIKTKYIHNNRNPSYSHRVNRLPKTTKIPQNLRHSFTHGTNLENIKPQETRGITEAQFINLMKQEQMTETMKQSQMLHEAFKETQLQEQQLRALVNQNQALLTNGRLPLQKQPHYQTNNVPNNVNVYPEFRPLNNNMNLAVLQQENQIVSNEQFNRFQSSTLSPIPQNPKKINEFNQGNGHQYSNVQHNDPLEQYIKQLYLNNANKENNIEVVKSQSYSFQMPENAPFSALIDNIESQDTQDSEIGFSQYESTYNTISPNASTKTTKDSELYRLHLEYRILDNLMKNIDKTKNKTIESSTPENVLNTRKPNESSNYNLQDTVRVSSQTESYESSNSKPDNYTMFLANVIKDSYKNKTNNAQSKQKEEKNPFYPFDGSPFRVAESTHKPTLHEKTEQRIKNNEINKNRESSTNPTLEYIVGNPNSHNYGPFYNAFSSSAMPFELHDNKPDKRPEPSRENSHVVYGDKMNADSDGYNLHDIKNINQFESNEENSFGFETLNVGRPVYDHSKTSTESYFDWIPKTNAEPLENTSQLSTGKKTYENYHGYYKKPLEKWTFNDTGGRNSAINYGKLNDFIDIMTNNGTKEKVESVTSTTTESLNNIIFNDIQKHLDLSLDMNGAKNVRTVSNVSREEESPRENSNEVEKSAYNMKNKNYIKNDVEYNDPLKHTNANTKPVQSALVNASPTKVVENIKKVETTRSRGSSKARKPVDNHDLETTFSDYSNVRRGKTTVPFENTSKSPVQVENDSDEQNKKNDSKQKENKGIDTVTQGDDITHDFESVITIKPTESAIRIKPTPKGTPNSHEKVEHETEFKDNLIPKNMMSHVPKSLPIITSTPTVISSTDIFLEKLEHETELKENLIPKHIMSHVPKSLPIITSTPTIISSTDIFQNNISRSFEPKFKPLPPQDEASIDIFDLFNNLGEPNFMKNPQKMDITNVNTTSSDTKSNVIETITLSTATTPLPITTIPTTVSITSTTTNMTKPRLVRGRGSLKTNKIDGNSTDTTTSIKSRRPVKITSKNETFESGAKVESSENSNDSAFDTRQHKRKYPRPARKHYGSDQDKSESLLSFENAKTSNKMVHKDSRDFRPSRTFTRESTTNNPVTTGPEPAANRVTVKPIQSIERVKIKNQIKEKLENSTKRYQANLSKIKGLYNHKNNSDLLERRLKNKERLLSRFSSSTVEPSSIESPTESEE